MRVLLASLVTLTVGLVAGCGGVESSTAAATERISDAALSQMSIEEIDDPYVARHRASERQTFPVPSSMPAVAATPARSFDE